MSTGKECLIFSITVVLLASFVVTDCSDDVSPQQYHSHALTSDSLYGEWEWVKTVGGISSESEINPSNAGYSIHLEFRQGYCSIIKDGTLVNQFHWNLSKQCSSLWGADSALVLSTDYHTSIYLPDSGRVRWIEDRVLAIDQNIRAGQSFVYRRLR